MDRENILNELNNITKVISTATPQTLNDAIFSIGYLDGRLVQLVHDADNVRRPACQKPKK